MELFYSNDISSSLVRLDREESSHCIKVLRHRVGDRIDIMDGEGTLMECRIVDADPRQTSAIVERLIPDFGSHGYRLEMAVCPTKNMARYEWFAEKATEVGLDCLVPVVGEHSERRSLNAERLWRIMLSAAKQSLKARVPSLSGQVSVSDYLGSAPVDALRLIAYCDESLEIADRKSIYEVLAESDLKSAEADGVLAGASRKPEICILIGPEGDFSQNEVSLARKLGWKPVHLGGSRLRTETAALAAAMAVYFRLG